MLPENITTFKVGDKVTFNRSHRMAPALFSEKYVGTFTVLKVEEVPEQGDWHGYVIERARESAGHHQWITIDFDGPGGPVFSGLYFETDAYLDAHYTGKERDNASYGIIDQIRETMDEEI